MSKCCKQFVTCTGLLRFKWKILFCMNKKGCLIFENRFKLNVCRIFIDKFALAPRLRGIISGIDLTIIKKLNLYTSYI